MYTALPHSGRYPVDGSSRNAFTAAISPVPHARCSVSVLWPCAFRPMYCPFAAICLPFLSYAAHRSQPDMADCVLFSIRIAASASLQPLTERNCIRIPEASLGMFVRIVSISESARFPAESSAQTVTASVCSPNTPWI